MAFRCCGLLPRRSKIQLLRCAFIITCVLSMLSTLSRSKHKGSLELLGPQEMELYNKNSLLEAFWNSVKTYKSRRNIIYVSAVNYTDIDLAINLYLTSFQRLGLLNHLFISLDNRACSLLSSYGAHCVEYWATESRTELDNNRGKIQNVGSASYGNLAHAEYEVAVEILKMNITVIMMHADVLLLKDPTYHLIDFPPGLELLVAMNEAPRNVDFGFYFAKPSENTISLLNHLRQSSMEDDKIPMNNLLWGWRMSNTNFSYDSLFIEILNTMMFQNGEIFFEFGNRMFIGDNPCTQCMMIHNNYVHSSAGKIHRYKEYGLWNMDSGAYYSDESRKYLIYENPGVFVFSHQNMVNELMALKTALTLGYFMNRTVILPRFHCTQGLYFKPEPNQMCHLASLYSIDAFDKFFKGAYRENVFFQHEKIPKVLFSSVSPLFVFGPDASLQSSHKSQFDYQNRPKVTNSLWKLHSEGQSDQPEQVKVLEITGAQNFTIHLEQLLGTLEQSKTSDYSILRFQSLYIRILHENGISPMEEKFSNAFVAVDFRQNPLQESPDQTNNLSIYYRCFLIIIFLCMFMLMCTKLCKPIYKHRRLLV